MPDTSARQRKFRFLITLLVIALAVLAFETFYYFAEPHLNPEQKMLLKWTGVRAPDFSATTIDGKTIRLPDLKGKRILLNFWATWCPPCQEEIPNFIKLREAVSPTNVFILGLSTDDAATQKTFAQQNGINYPLAILQNVPSPYQNIALIPATIVIDRNGVIQEAVLGPQTFETLEKFANESDFSGTVKSVPEIAN